MADLDLTFHVLGGILNISLNSSGVIAKSKSSSTDAAFIWRCVDFYLSALKTVDQWINSEPLLFLWKH